MNELFTFRDPAGRLLMIEGRVLRIVNQAAVKDLEHCLTLISQTAGFDQIVRTRVLDGDAKNDLLHHNGRLKRAADWSEAGVVLEHEKIPFPSFPYEWSPGMLHAAASLTIDLAERFLREGISLKDATPYNILFRGPKPVLIDILSFERRAYGDPTWLAYAQFVRTFLLPLLVNKYFNLPLDQVLINRRDGLEPQDVYQLCSALRKFKKPFLSLVTIPTLLSRKKGLNQSNIYSKKILNNHDKAIYVLAHLFKRLRCTLDELIPDDRKKSMWSDYADFPNVSSAYYNNKQLFIQNVLREYRPRNVLDVGCNAGQFSVMAAQHGSSVVAIDCDPIVVGKAWKVACENNLNILPLVVNLCRPTPSIGWRNCEKPSFLDRANGFFDAVFMLAVIHHMLVNEQIPLQEILSLASEMTNDLLIIEYIGPQDALFETITRGRDYLYHHLTNKFFESACMEHFEIIRRVCLLPKNRWIYVLRKRKRD